MKSLLLNYFENKIKWFGLFTKESDQKEILEALSKRSEKAPRVIYENRKTIKDKK